MNNTALNPQQTLARMSLEELRTILSELYGFEADELKRLEVDGFQPKKRNPMRLFLRARRTFTAEEQQELMERHSNIQYLYPVPNRPVGGAEWHIVIDPIWPPDVLAKMVPGIK